MEEGLGPYIPTAHPLDGNNLSTGVVDIFGGVGDVSPIIALIAAIIGTIWSVYAFLAYIVSIIMLVIYIYATMRWNHLQEVQAQQLRDLEELYDQHYRGVHKNSRLQEVYLHIDSENPNDWKLAIIEADIVLDDILKQRGYAGNSLGERLRSIAPSQLSTLDDAWEAHKVRNQIAHGGADFVLTKRLAEETINRYRRVFGEFGIV
jgi:hypothetical protein